MFDLETGPFQTLEDAFLKKIAAQKKSDPLASILVLSPSGQMLTRLERRLAAEQGYLNIHFLTFFALADRVMAEAPATEGVMVTEPALYREIVHEYLEGKGDVPFLSRDLVKRPGTPVPRGLAAALASTLKDLQDSGAKVVDCANVAREGHLGDFTESAVPILELNVLMYKTLHDRGLRTSADFMRRAAERTSTSPWIKTQKAIHLYGFYDLTGVQLDLVLALTKQPNASVYIPNEEGNPAYRFADSLLAAVNGSSGQRERQREVVSIRDPLSPPHALTAARVDRPTIESFSCSGTNAEVWWSAKKVISLLDAGVPPAEIAVIARTLDPYLNTIRQLFEAHRIPYALHSEESVGGYPLVKSIQQGLKERVTSGVASWASHVAWCLEEFDLGATPLETAIGKAIQSLSALDVLGRPVSWHRFKDVLEEKLVGLRVKLTPDNVNGVQIMDVMSARGLYFQAVYVLGLNEKLFPRLIREDPFLSDAARSVLSQALGCRLGRKMDGFQEEKLLFHLTTQLARETLYLSCQRSDEEGKALVLSLYLHDFLHKTGVKFDNIPRAWPERVQRVPPEALTPKEISIAYHRENRSPDALYKGLNWDVALMHHLLDAQKDIESFGDLGLHDGQIGPTPMQEALLEAGLSPGILQDLAECPFRVFSQKVLSLYADEGMVADGELTHTGRGKVIHSLLQQYYQRGLSSDSLDSLVDEEFRQLQEVNGGLYPLLQQAEKSKILSMLKRFIPMDEADQRESGFKPSAFELPVTGTLQGVKLKGRIDRIDKLSGTNPSFRVVDYKSGSAGLKKGQPLTSAILKGESFQLPVYVALAKTWLESQKDPAAREGEALFYELKKDDAVESAHRLGAEFWKEHGDTFYKNLVFLTKNVENGTFYIRPSDSSRGYCSWCEYASICRKEHKPTQIRSENSSAHRRHDEAFSGKS